MAAIFFILTATLSVFFLTLAVVDQIQGHHATALLFCMFCVLYGIASALSLKMAKEKREHRNGH